MLAANLGAFNKCQVGCRPGGHSLSQPQPVCSVDPAPGLQMKKGSESGLLPKDTLPADCGTKIQNKSVDCEAGIVSSAPGSGHGESQLLPRQQRRDLSLCIGDRGLGLGMGTRGQWGFYHLSRDLADPMGSIAPSSLPHHFILFFK